MRGDAEAYLSLHMGEGRADESPSHRSTLFEHLGVRAVTNLQNENMTTHNKANVWTLKDTSILNHLCPNKRRRHSNCSRCQSSESSITCSPELGNYIHKSIQFLYFLPFPLFWLPFAPFDCFPLPPLARCSFLFIPRMSFFRRLSTTLKAPLTPGGRLTFLPAPFLVTTYVTSLFSFPTPAFL